MARDYYINGETMVYIKGRAPYAAKTELGLSDQPIRVSVEYQNLGIQVNAYGQVPPERQAMGSMARVYMSLVHFDKTALRFLIQEATGGGPSIGTLGHAGTRYGGGQVIGHPECHYVSLGIESALGQDPWTFAYGVLANNPLEWPLGAERSIVSLSWEIVPYSVDPWNAGQGSYGVPLWTHTAMV